MNNVTVEVSTNSLHSNTQSPSHIESNHFQEWLNSGVKQSIISNNVWSILDAQEVDKVLNRNNKSRWKHSDNLVPCWAVRGVDPLTGERTLLGVQIKPDKPILNKDGKHQKYLGASTYNATPLFLDAGIEDFWKTAVDDKTERIILTEGAKKAGAALSIGHTTISIPGVTTCKKKGRLHFSLELFTGFGRVFYLAFDNDVMQKRQVQTALLGIARELTATGSKVMVICLPPGELKGIDDFIVAKGEEAFNQLVDSALTIEEWHDQIKETWREQLEEIKSTKRSKIARYMEILKLGWGHELKYNELKSQVELSEQLLDFDQVRLRIALEFDLDVPIQDAQSIVENLAKENSYHPVSDYLDGLARQYPQPDLSILDDLASRYFGTDEPLHNLYLRKTLIAAVARVKETTICKHDEATILVGGQGIGKSTFWEKLFSTEWFTDELGDANEKDELMKLHRFWGLEWAEFETVYKRKEYSALKKFMTTKVDPIRTPYSRSLKEYRRKSILVGTTNEQEILADPTGSRRFWIIPVNRRIPTDLLEEERDRIWAAAYALYRSGEQWFLNREHSDQQEEMNEEYQTQDPWREIIQTYLHTQSEVTLGEIFHCLSIEPARQDTGMQKRITSILRNLQWESDRINTEKGRVRVWKEKKINVGNSAGQKGVSKGPAAVQETKTTDSCNENTYYTENNETFITTSQDEACLETSIAIDTLKNPGPLETPFCPPEKPTLDSFLVEMDKRGEGFAPSLPAPIKIKFASPLGDVRAIATHLGNGKYEFQVTYPGVEEIDAITVDCTDDEKATKLLKRRVGDWRKKLRFSVMQVPQDDSLEYVWIANCKCVDIPSKHLHKSQWVFETPAGDRIWVAGDNEFRVEV